MISPSHQLRIDSFTEAAKTKAADRAKAIFELVNCLAQARPFVTDLELRRRIADALNKSHVAIDGEFFVDTDHEQVVVLAGQGR